MAVDELERGSGTGMVRVVGTWFIAAGLLAGLFMLMSDYVPSARYLSVPGVLVFMGVGLRIEAAIRGVALMMSSPSSTGADSNS
jgi:hypothetical protein